MQIIDATDGFSVKDYLDGSDDPRMQNDDVLDIASNNPGKPVIIMGETSKLANDSNFLNLLAWDEYPNITAVPQLLQLIKADNLNKIRKQLIIDELENFIENTNDSERIVVILNIIGDKLGISDVKLAKDNKISMTIDNEDHIGQVVYGRVKENNEFKLSNNIKFTFELPNEDFDYIKESKVMLDINRNISYAIINNIESYNKPNTLTITQIEPIDSLKINTLVSSAREINFNNHPFDKAEIIIAEADYCEQLPNIKNIDKYIAYDPVTKTTCLYDQNSSSVVETYETGEDNSLDSSYKIRIVAFIPKEEVFKALKRKLIKFN